MPRSSSYSNSRTNSYKPSTRTSYYKPKPVPSPPITKSPSITSTIGDSMIQGFGFGVGSSIARNITDSIMRPYHTSSYDMRPATGPTGQIAPVSVAFPETSTLQDKNQKPELENNSFSSETLSEKRMCDPYIDQYQKCINDMKKDCSSCDADFNNYIQCIELAMKRVC